MGIYSSQALGRGANTVEVEPQLYSESMGLMETTYCILAENEANWNTFMKAVGLQELCYLESYGEEMVYTEGAIGDFFENAKNWFKKLFAKVKGLFEKFMAKIRSYISSDSSFVSKYEDKIREGAGKIPSSAEFKGYPFTNVHKFEIPNTLKASGHDGLTPFYEALKSNITNNRGYKDSEGLKVFIKKWREKEKEDELDKIRGSLINQKKIDSSDFNTELTEYLKGDKDTFDDRYLSEYTTFINEIKTSKETINKAKDDFNAVKDNINEAISQIEDCEDLLKTKKEEIEEPYKSNPKKNDSGREDYLKLYDQKITAAQEIISFYKDVLQIYTSANGKHLECLKQYNRQCKAICVKLVGFASRQSSENASYNYFQSERYVGGITLV